MLKVRAHNLERPNGDKYRIALIADEGVGAAIVVRIWENKRYAPGEKTQRMSIVSAEALFEKIVSDKTGSGYRPVGPRMDGEFDTVEILSNEKEVGWVLRPLPDKDTVNATIADFLLRHENRKDEPDEGILEALKDAIKGASPDWSANADQHRREMKTPAKREVPLPEMWGAFA